MSTLESQTLLNTLYPVAREDVQRIDTRATAGLCVRALKVCREFEFAVRFLNRFIACHWK